MRARLILAIGLSLGVSPPAIASSVFKHFDQVWASRRGNCLAQQAAIEGGGAEGGALGAGGVREGMRWLPGGGWIDLVGFFQGLKAIGYQGGVSPEVIGPRIPKEMAPEESARIALDATIAVMKKAGAV